VHQGGANLNGLMEQVWMNRIFNIEGNSPEADVVAVAEGESVTSVESAGLSA
jgi:hypothetical protein